MAVQKEAGQIAQEEHKDGTVIPQSESLCADGKTMATAATEFGIGMANNADLDGGKQGQQQQEGPDRV